MEKSNSAMIAYNSSGKADIKASAIRMTDSSSLPKKKEAMQNESTILIEKVKKLPLFYEHKIKGKKFDLF